MALSLSSIYVEVVFCSLNKLAWSGRGRWVGEVEVENALELDQGRNNQELVDWQINIQNWVFVSSGLKIKVRLTLSQIVFGWKWK
jgi:hypothetical protein